MLDDSNVGLVADDDETADGDKGEKDDLPQIIGVEKGVELTASIIVDPFGLVVLKVSGL